MRTLVVGIPLPHVTYDNYSFLSAPSFQEYRRLIVEMGAISRAVEEVVAAAAEHRTFAGQPVANGPPNASTFSLPQLLAMRRREADSFLGRGGLVVCFAHPNIVHVGVSGLDRWDRYA